MLLERVLEDDPVAVDAVVRETSVGETYFFREDDGLRYLTRRLTTLHRRQLREDEPRKIRLWSAGCASGEEAYSMVIVALETLGPDADIEVIGTDVNPAAVARAEAATYGPWSFRGVSEAHRTTWFEPAGGDGELLRPIAEVRRHAQFARVNLAQDDTPSNRWVGSFDLIFCRNVLLYFGSTELPVVARRLSQTLVDGGRLVLGATDPSLVSPALLRVAQVPPVYRRHDEVSARRSRGSPIPRATEDISVDPPPPVAPVRAQTTRATRKTPVHKAPRAPDPARVAALPVPGGAPTAAAEPPVHSPKSPPVETEVYLRAKELADRGAYAEAALLLDEEMTEHPLDPALYILRGMVALSTGDAAQALRRADSALLLDSSLAMAHLLAAMAAVKQQSPTRARKSAQNALVALTKGGDPPPFARESKDDLLRACRAILGATTPNPPNVRSRDGRRR